MFQSISSIVTNASFWCRMLTVREAVCWGVGKEEYGNFVLSTQLCYEPKIAPKGVY